jgi:hypothetical protein
MSFVSRAKTLTCVGKFDGVWFLRISSSDIVFGIEVREVSSVWHGPTYGPITARSSFGGVMTMMMVGNLRRKLLSSSVGVVCVQ